MKFPCYGLIISLNLFIFSASFGYAKENKTKNTPSLPSIIAVDTAVPSAIKEDNFFSQPVADPFLNQDTENKINNLKKNISEISKDTDKKINDLQQTIKQTAEYLSKQDDTFKNKLSVSTMSIANQINEIKQKQNNMLIMIDSLKEQYKISRSTIAKDDGQIDEVKKEQEDMMSMLIKLNESQEILKDKVSVLTGNMERTSVATSTSTQKPGLAPSKASGQQNVDQQYVKLKLLEDGQEVEMSLDPSSVDMNIALPRNKKDDKTGKTLYSGKDNDNIDKIMQYLSQFPKTSANPPQQGQQQQNPSLSNTNSPDNPAIGDSQTLDELLKAQRLFYEKKYNAALNAVQRSMSKQETALAYAIEGSIYFTMGDVDLAISSWENALKLNPNMTEVKKALFKYKR